eukprot:g13351.t1 g13351   contig8:465505-467258(+)
MTVPIHYLPLSATYSFLAGLVYVVYAAYTDTRSPITGPAQSVSDFIPVVYVTVSSILLYYVFLYNQSATVFVEFAKAKKEHRDKKKEGEAPSLAKIKYGLDNFTVIAANRCAGNYGEQLIPFLISLYLHSLFAATVFIEFAKAKKEHSDAVEGEGVQGEEPSLVKIKYGLENFNVLAANRSAGNYGEQLIPFLVSLYLYSTFMSVDGAIKCGWSWLVFRSYYSWAFKIPFPGVFLSTMPAYFCIWWMIGGTVYAIAK